MNTFKVLFTGCTLTEEKIEKLLKKGIQIIKAPSNLNEKMLISALKNCDAVIANGEEFYTQKVLENANKLKLIQYFGIGYEKCVDLKTAKQYGIIVANTPKVNSYSVAEFTLGLIFILNQKLAQLNEETKKGIWKETNFFDLKEKTVGVIGLGHIGIPFAEMMYNAFHTKILYYDIENRKEQEKSLNATKTTLESLLEKADVVSIHLPLTGETRNLIGKKELSLMKKTALLINTARAEIVDAESLFKALENNEIAGCAYDGFYQEPIDLNSKEAKLLSLPTNKFILTPHTGYNAIEGTSRVEKMCIENLLLILNDKPCKNIVNK